MVVLVYLGPPQLKKKKHLDKLTHSNGENGLADLNTGNIAEAPSKPHAHGRLERQDPVPDHERAVFEGLWWL